MVVGIGPPSGVVSEYTWNPGATSACSLSKTVLPGATAEASVERVH